MRSLSLLIALLLPLAAFSTCQTNILTGNPTGAPISANIPQLGNGCLPEALRCQQDLAGSHTEARVLLMAYTVDGQRFGHAMCIYWWPARPDPCAVHYAYDRTNASTALPASIGAEDALSIARHMIPSVVYAEWSGKPVN